MKEDDAIETVVKTALEEPDASSDVRFGHLAENVRAAAVRRRFWRRVRLSGGCLAAASLAGALVLHALMPQREASSTDVAEVGQAICLLCDLPEMPNGEEAIDEAAERLLAWQEAPCAGLL